MKTKIQNKKIYSKPLLEVIAVDHEISLVMESGPPDNPIDPYASAKKNDPKNSGPLNFYKPASSSDAFGGDSPQF